MSWSGHIFLIHFINSSQMRLMSNLIFKAKLVVSRCAFCKLQWDFGFFCSINHFIEGGVYVNHSVMCLSSLVENDSRLLKNSKGNRDGERTFYQRKEADVSLFLQVTRIRKVRKIWEANFTSWLLPKTGAITEQWTLKHKTNKTDRNPPEPHINDWTKCSVIQGFDLTKPILDWTLSTDWSNTISKPANLFILARLRSTLEILIQMKGTCHSVRITWGSVFRG